MVPGKKYAFSEKKGRTEGVPKNLAGRYRAEDNPSNPPSGIYVDLGGGEGLFPSPVRIFGIRPANDRRFPVSET